MRKTSVLAAMVLSAVCGTMVACDDGDDLTAIDQGQDFSANLTSTAEIPAPSGSLTATGTATFNLTGRVLTAVVTVNGNLTSPVTMAHIHGPATPSTTADIIFDFVPSMSPYIGAGVTSGTVVSASFDLDTLPVSATGVLRIDPDLLIAYLQGSQTYVNVHTQLNPSGEIRGMITPN